MARPPDFRPRPILDALLAHEVDFVLIGGLAGVVRGSSYPTYDVDIAYGRARENLERLAAALNDLGAKLRGAPDGIPFLLDAKTLQNVSLRVHDSARLHRHPHRPRRCATRI